MSPGQDVETVHRGVGLPWLVLARWATLAAQAGAALLGAVVLDVPVRWLVVAGVLAVTALTNVWLRRDLARPRNDLDVAGVLHVVDTVGLGAVLVAAGGPLNPASIYFLVLITQAAFVHGPRVATVVSATAIVLYGLLFVMITPELEAALAMHPEVHRHFQGMWWAFAVTAALVTMFVAHLAAAVTQRDANLRALEARIARSEALTRLATLAADAAHELGTPLATIALTAGELERTLSRSPGAAERTIDDVRLIREESHRCRGMLDDMAARAGQPVGGEPREASVSDILNRALTELGEPRSERVDVCGTTEVRGRWPVEAVARALLNVLRNAFDASPADTRVSVQVALQGDTVLIDVIDTGSGMTADVLARAGEPFFTTRPGSGRGLGLVVAHATLEAIGGRLEFESTPGRGTRARLLLPAEQRP